MPDQQDTVDGMIKYFQNIYNQRFTQILQFAEKVIIG